MSENPRGRDYVLVTVPDSSAPIPELRPGERFLKRRVLYGPSDGAYILLALERRKEKVNRNMRRHRDRAPSRIDKPG